MANCAKRTCRTSKRRLIIAFLEEKRGLDKAGCGVESLPRAGRDQSPDTRRGFHFSDYFNMTSLSSVASPLCNRVLGKFHLGLPSAADLLENSDVTTLLWVTEVNVTR